VIIAIYEMQKELFVNKKLLVNQQSDFHLLINQHSLRTLNIFDRIFECDTNAIKQTQA